MLLLGVIGAALLSSLHRAPYAHMDDLPGNLHMLEPGRVYRSAQPDPDELETAIQVLGIRTVLNLRGNNRGQPWYEAESRLCARYGVDLLDRAMSSRSLPPVEFLREVLEDFRQARYPMLIHCNAGADRTGAISAVYRVAILGDHRERASEELSPEFLHFQPFTPCMDDLILRFDASPAGLAAYEVLATQPCSE